MDYGEVAARRRARAKNQREVKTPSQSSSGKKKKRSVNLQLYPLDSKSKTTRKDINIDWLDADTNIMSDELSRRLSDDSAPKMQILKLPTGLGKTSAAVATMGKMQKDDPTISFAVIASRAIIDGGGWRATIESWNDAHPDNVIRPVLIETYDRFANILDDTKALATFIKEAGHNTVLVLDEVHNYKNPVSKRAKKMQKLRHCRKLGLSATPLTNDLIMDTCSYLVLAGYYPNKSRFMQETRLDKHVGFNYELTVYDENGFVDTTIWPEYNDVMKQLSTIMYSPDVSMRYESIMPNVETTVHQLESSEQLRADIVSLKKAYMKRMFDSATDLMLELKRRIYCDTERLNKCVSVATSDGVVQPLMFYWHTVTRDYVVEELTKLGLDYQELSGSSSLSDIDTTRDCPILIQYQSGAEGVEFKLSNTMIAVENQPSYVLYKQAQGRNVRRGMEHCVHHHYFVSDIEFDSNMFSRVMQKEEVAESVLTEMALETIGVSKTSA